MQSGILRKAMHFLGRVHKQGCSLRPTIAARTRSLRGVKWLTGGNIWRNEALAAVMRTANGRLEMA